MLGLQYFGWTAQWSPYFLVFLILIGLLYFLGIGKFRDRFKDSESVSTKMKVYFVSGLAVIYIAHGSPLDLLGHLIFSAHMTSMALAFLIAPPLILLGLPDWMLRPVMNRFFSGRASVLFHPLTTILAFNGLFSFYHFPAVHDYVMTHYFVHTLYYIILYASSLLMWWYMVSPLPDWRRLSDLKRLGYVFVAGVLLTPACALIIFAKDPLYAIYSDPATWTQALGYCAPGVDVAWLLQQTGGPSFFALIEPLHDQQLGGVIMKLIQECMYGAILFYIFIRWYRSENVGEDLNPTVDQEEDISLGTSGQFNRI